MLKKIFLFSVSFLFSVNLFSSDSFKYGLGLSIVSTPSYVGSKKQNTTVVPFPYIELRSKYINIDKDKIYNEFYNSHRTKIEFSIRGMLPADSEGTLREGMKDLDAIVEIGPKLTYNLVTKNLMKIDFEVPVRAAFSIGSNIDYQGLLGSLDLSYKNIIFNDYKLRFTTGLGFADKKFNNYYYEVTSSNVNATRSEYHSKSGYSGFHNTMAITKKTEHFWYGGFMKHYYLENTIFEDSPLVETNSALFYGLAFSYIF
ncbi:MAG: hypothetical protein CL623_01765 [Arcobacter sp.]|nr:hypothetical protein [Arcobacter sp.]|tara:strand:+ start:27715 stop:28485 length:771 start_codon:yes stop_codon:yes gene_type:complete